MLFILNNIYIPNLINNNAMRILLAKLEEC